MGHFHSQKRLVGGRPVEAVLKQEAMLFGNEEGQNQHIHLGERGKYCSGFSLAIHFSILHLIPISIAGVFIQNTEKTEDEHTDTDNPLSSWAYGKHASLRCHLLHFGKTDAVPGRMRVIGFESS